jgi:hypothetical protein
MHRSTATAAHASPLSAGRLIRLDDRAQAINVASASVKAIAVSGRRSSGYSRRWPIDG